MMKVILVAGARPNFMKIAPICRVSKMYQDVHCILVHTGQHYDYEMSQTFFNDLELPMPDYFLNAGSGSHATQTAIIMTAFEKVCLDENPDGVVVVGDVNSTLACSIVAKKLGQKIAHVEAGLRSFDLSMPEEINRMVTDSITDCFFVTEESGVENLLREGKDKSRIHHVGNVMIDNLLHQVKKLKTDDVSRFATDKFKKAHPSYLFLTLHRPSNVDHADTFAEIAGALNTIAEEKPVIFPVHPRTRAMIERHGIRFSKNIHQVPPLGFRESLYLWKDADAVLTDSGGLQEETTALGIPCITIRENTERPVTVEIGTNILAGTKKDRILEAYRFIPEKMRRCRIPAGWDGSTAFRIWDILTQINNWIGKQTV